MCACTLSFCILIVYSLVFQIEEILRDFGIVCVSRVGSNPEQFVYNSDVLYKHQVSSIAVQIILFVIFILYDSKS